MPKNTSEFSPEHYLNRELSWLEFNARVLEEAADATNPVLERMKFLSIVSSNLDEFFEVRVAGLQEQLYAGLEPQDFPADGLAPEEQLDRIDQRAHRLIAEQYQLLHRELIPQLGQNGIEWVRLVERKHASQMQELFAVVQVPAVLDRVVLLPRSAPERLRFVLLEDIIAANL